MFRNAAGAFANWRLPEWRRYGFGENLSWRFSSHKFITSCGDFNRDMHSPDSIILASGSAIRLRLLRNAGVRVLAKPAAIDEEAMGASLREEGAGPKEMSSALAELKAVRMSQRYPECLVIGCDQVLEFDGRPVSKCLSSTEAFLLLKELRGKSHQLHSSAVVCLSTKPIWRHTSTAKILMKDHSDGFLDAYVQRNAGKILDSVGCYLIEEEGIRLIGAIAGDYFTVCGLPLLPLLAYLEDLGILEQ